MKLIVKEVSKGSLTLVPGGKSEEPEAEPQIDAGAWDEETPDGFEAGPSLDTIQDKPKNHLKLVVKERKNS